MLGDRLTRQAKAVPCGEQGAHLEEGLAVRGRKLVEDQTPRLVVKSPEHIDHDGSIGKISLAYQEPASIAGQLVSP
jgi:hypothetical protein